MNNSDEMRKLMETMESLSEDGDKAAAAQFLKEKGITASDLLKPALSGKSVPVTEVNQYGEISNTTIENLKVNVVGKMEMGATIASNKNNIMQVAGLLLGEHSFCFKNEDDAAEYARLLHGPE